MSIYALTPTVRKALIAEWKPKMDTMLVVGKGAEILKTSIIFSYKEKEQEMRVQYVARVKYIPKFGAKTERISIMNVLQTSIQTLPNCCGILLMNGGSRDLWEEGQGAYLEYKKGSHLWTTFCQMIFDYADKAGYGKVLATDRDGRTDGIAKRLKVETISKFKNPRTHNTISVYFKHIKDG